MLPYSSELTGADLRAALIEAKLLKPAAASVDPLLARMTRFRNAANTPVACRLDPFGRKHAARRIALAARGIADNGLQD